MGRLFITIREVIRLEELDEQINLSTESTEESTTEEATTEAPKEEDIYTEVGFDYGFIPYVGGEALPWGVFAAMCWNLALLYFAFEIIKFADVKFEKIFRRFGKDNG